MLKTHSCFVYRPKRLSPLFRSVLIFLSAWLLISPFSSLSVQAAQVKLAWDPSPGPDAEGYKVYYGTASRSYSYTVNVGPSTACVVAGLQDGMSYYFATTAYNGSLQESVFSNEVSYTAGPPPDTTPPTVSSTSPANSVTGVPINTAINATFSEAMDPASITTATFTLKAGSTSIGGTVSYSGTTATFTPSSFLAYNTTFTATITTGVRDLAGNAMQSACSWSFATGLAPDVTPPTVSSTDPGNGVIWVSVSTAIRATFSEAMDPASITTATFTLKAGSTSIGGTVSYRRTRATFIPSSSLAYDTTYTATITTGVRDLAGNVMQANYSWSFTTGSRSRHRR
jgi:Bacterial Ig-like domain/Fibronectin type III domain